jgi:preprotein translocase subunit SecG
MPPSHLSKRDRPSYNSHLIIAGNTLSEKGNPMGWLAGPLNIILILLGLFLILLVLIQRGKGGGLIGALGGAGGSSPFGSRAGDQFTRLTIYVAAVWLFMVMLQGRAVQRAAEYRYLESQFGIPPGR